MARLKYNAPRHGLGPKGHAREIKPLSAHAHTAQRVNTGFHDAHGYQGSNERRQGKQTGGAPKGDSNIRKGAHGNSHGSAPPGVGHGNGVKGSVATHAAAAGRGAPGRFGKADAHTGKPKAWPEEISHSEFESLGAK